MERVITKEEIERAVEAWESSRDGWFYRIIL